jgi:hypothetical protein
MNNMPDVQPAAVLLARKEGNEKPFPTTTASKRSGPISAKNFGVKVTVQKQNKICLDQFTSTIVPCRIPQLVFTFNQGIVLFGFLLGAMAVIRQLIAD